MKKSAVILSAVLSTGVFAAEQKHSWFDTDIGEIPSETRNWPVDGSNYEAYLCHVTNTAAATFADGRLVVNAEEPMTVVPNEAAMINDFSYARVSAVMKMTPFDVTGVPEVPEGAKTAVIAVASGAETNFWVAAGTETLFWTNTQVSADVTREVGVEISFTYCADGVATEWIFDGESRFSCKSIRAAELRGVAFRGVGELSSCWGDAQAYGDLVDFFITGIPEEVIVSVTTTNGTELAKTELGVYRYLSGGTVRLAFALPSGWRYCEDGASVWEDSIVRLAEGGYVPYGGRGIFDTDIGPTDYWMSVPWDGPVERFATLDEAMAAMKHYRALESCYSESPRVITVAEDGKTITVDGVVKAAKPRYHYVSFDGMPVSMIDEGEAEITSVRENGTDATLMSIGSVPNTFSGFDYSVIYADDVGFTEGLGETEPVRGDGGKLELAAPKGDKGRRFYRISITD